MPDSNNTGDADSKASGATSSSPKRLKPALLADLLPANVQSALEILPTADSLLPAVFDHAEEAAVVANAVPKRQRDFAAGRRLAHELLAAAGAPAEPLLPGSDRSPMWPQGFTGAISHCDGLCVASVASTEAHTAIGVDVEVAKPLKVKLWSLILGRSEADRLEVLGPRGAVLAMAHFSAKEAVYKLIAAEFGRFVAFGEVELRFGFKSETFTAHGGATDAERARLADVRGRWRITGRHILTTAVWNAG